MPDPDSRLRQIREAYALMEAAMWRLSKLGATPITDEDRDWAEREVRQLMEGQDDG